MSESNVSSLFGIPWMSLAGLFGGGTFGAVLVALIRAWPGLRKTAVDGDASLRVDLMKRISALEAAAFEERRECEKKLEAMRVRLEAMHEKVDGLVRQLLQYQVTTGQALPIAVRSPAIEHALESLTKAGLAE